MWTGLSDLILVEVADLVDVTVIKAEFSSSSPLFLSFFLSFLSSHPLPLFVLSLSFSPMQPKQCSSDACWDV